MIQKKKMSLKMKILTASVLLLLAVVIYSFLWERLFPFSPIIIGFEKMDFNKAEKDIFFILMNGELYHENKA